MSYNVIKVVQIVAVAEVIIAAAAVIVVVVVVAPLALNKSTPSDYIPYHSLDLAPELGYFPNFQANRIKSIPTYFGSFTFSLWAPSNVCLTMLPIPFLNI